MFSSVDPCSEVASVDLKAGTLPRGGRDVPARTLWTSEASGTAGAMSPKFLEAENPSVELKS